MDGARDNGPAVPRHASDARRRCSVSAVETYQTVPYRCERRRLLLHSAPVLHTVLIVESFFVCWRYDGPAAAAVDAGRTFSVSAHLRSLGGAEPPHCGPLPHHPSGTGHNTWLLCRTHPEHAAPPRTPIPRLCQELAAAARANELAVALAEHPLERLWAPQAAQPRV